MGGSAHRRDPCSCRLVGPDGANTVRPRPRRACGNSSLTTYAPSWRHTACTWQVGCPWHAAKLQFADSVARYSHADWEREQQVESTCHAAMRYITISRPSALPPDVLPWYPSHKDPSNSDIQDLAGKGRLRTTDDNIVLLVLTPTPPPTTSDEPSSVWRAA